MKKFVERMEELEKHRPAGIEDIDWLKLKLFFTIQCQEIYREIYGLINPKSEAEYWKRKEDEAKYKADESDIANPNMI